MVQRKTGHDRFGQEHCRSLEPEMRPRPSRLPQPTTPVAKVTGGSPNYMKGTSSSESRRQSQGFHAGSDKKSQVGNKLDSCSDNKKQNSSSRSLKKGLNFKRSSRIGCFPDVNAHRATCSSFLRDSKFSDYLKLTSPSVLKLCSYTYCSLNAHLHLQFPPLKSFISAKRRSLKSQTSMKKNGDDGCVNVYVDDKKEDEHENGSIREVVDIQVIDFLAENMDMEWGEAGDKRRDDLGSENAEMVSLLDGKGIESMEDSCNDDLETFKDAESCGYGNASISVMIDNFVILEQSENASVEQESNKENALDERLTSQKDEDWEEADGEEETAKERNEFVSKTEETLLTLARKHCNREESIEDWREINPREHNYLPIFEEPGSEKVELKHQYMDKRKNAEEWMIDYALQHTIRRLASERKKKVALLVEAFETILLKKPSLIDHTFKLAISMITKSLCE